LSKDANATSEIREKQRDGGQLTGEGVARSSAGAGEGLASEGATSGKLVAVPLNARNGNFHAVGTDSEGGLADDGHC
jgi:hypothetical protein